MVHSAYAVGNTTLMLWFILLMQWDTLCLCHMIHSADAAGHTIFRSRFILLMQYTYAMVNSTNAVGHTIQTCSCHESFYLRSIIIMDISMAHDP